MSMEQKIAFTRRIAEYQAELYRYGNRDLAFKAIGTLNVESAQNNREPSSTGQIVCRYFCMGDHLKYDVPRGPFSTSQDWIRSKIELVVHDNTEIVNNSENDANVKSAQEILTAAGKLLSILHRFMPIWEKVEPTVICHEDLSLNNILVDEEGEITAIIDWEFVSTLPYWMAVRMPKFLDTKPRRSEPNIDDYGPATPPSEIPEPSYMNRNLNGSDNQGKSSAYWEDRTEYEATLLREVYSERLEQLWPDWWIEKSFMKADFCEAMIHCCAGFFVNEVIDWADEIQKGSLPRFWGQIENETEL
jgi:hypothetical protein